MSYSENKKGFSLIEIIVVLIIVGLLAGLIYPKYTITIERTRFGEGVELLSALRRAQEAHSLENGTYTTTMADLDIEITNASYFNDPTLAGTAAAPTMHIQRSTGAYTINMSIAGVITCTNAATPPSCANLGY